MLSILKTFGLGLLYTVLSPFIVLILALYFIYTFLAFIIMFFINIFKFFKGKSITDKLPIDIEAEKILLAQEQYEAKLKEAIINNQLNVVPNANNVVVPNANNVIANNTPIPPVSNETNNTSNELEGGDNHD